MAVSAGNCYSLVLLENGDVYAFGRNHSGQLGLGDYTERNTPTKIPGISGAVAVSAGYNNSLVLLANGDVYGFGGGTPSPTPPPPTPNVLPIHPSGVMNIGDYYGNLPTKIPGISEAKAVSAGWYYSLALLANGDVYGFGTGFPSLPPGPIGPSGVSNIGDYVNPPTKIPGISGAKAVSAGLGYSLVLLENGEVYAFGLNLYGELGLGDYESRSTPTKIPGISGVVAVSAGEGHSLVVAETGKIMGACPVDSYVSLLQDGHVIKTSFAPDGNYAFKDVSAGTYEVCASKRGYISGAIEEVTVSSGEAITKNLEGSLHPVASRGPYGVTAWIGHQSWDKGRDEFNVHTDLFDQVSPDGYTLADDATSVITWTDGQGDFVANPSEELSRLQEVAHPAEIAYIPLLGCKSHSLIEDMLSDSEKRTGHITSICDMVVQHQYEGIDIDYENIDRSYAWAYDLFVNELAEELHKCGKLAIITVQAKTWGLGNPFNYDEWFKDEVEESKRPDEVRIMCYDNHHGKHLGGLFHYYHSRPDWIKKVTSYALSHGIPADKLRLGLPTYGYIDVIGGKDIGGKAIVWDDAKAILDAHPDISVLRDADDIPHFEFNSHQYWYEDALSLEKKLTKITGKHLKGIALWRLGSSDPNIFDFISSWQLGTSAIHISAQCPVDLVVTAPDGHTIDKDLNEIPDAIYWSEDLDGDGSLDVRIDMRRHLGSYWIAVKPKPTAEDDDTYTLVFKDLYSGQTITLANNALVTNARHTSYEIKVTGQGSYLIKALHDSSLSIGPNPVPSEGCIFWLNLPDDTTNATLKIFDIDGAELVNIPLDPTADRYPAAGRWIPEDDQGRLLGTGLYLYLVEIEHTDGTVTYSPAQKMVIQR